MLFKKLNEVLLIIISKPGFSTTKKEKLKINKEIIEVFRS